MNRIAPVGQAHPRLVLTGLIQAEVVQAVQVPAIPAPVAPVLPVLSAAKEVSRAPLPPAAANPEQAAHVPAANPKNLPPTARMAQDRVAALPPAPSILEPDRVTGRQPARSAHLAAHPPVLSAPAQVHVHPVRQDRSLRAKAVLQNPAPAARSPIPTPHRAPKDRAVQAGSPRPATEAPANQLQRAARNPAASPNPVTKANRPAPSGPVLPAERSVAKKPPPCLAGVTGSMFFASAVRQEGYNVANSPLLRRGNLNSLTGTREGKWQTPLERIS